MKYSDFSFEPFDTIPEAAASAVSTAPAALTALQHAIALALDALLAEQKPDGHWVYELEADATIPAEYVLMVHFLGEPANPLLESRIAKYLCRIQSEDGGWPLFHAGAVNVSASVKAYFALKMIGVSPEAAAYGEGARSDTRARRRGSQQCFHPHAAGAVRYHSLASAPGDASRNRLVAALVSIPLVQGVLLDPHGGCAFVGA